MRQNEWMKKNNIIIFQRKLIPWRSVVNENFNFIILVNFAFLQNSVARSSSWYGTKVVAKLISSEFIFSFAFFSMGIFFQRTARLYSVHKHEVYLVTAISTLSANYYLKCSRKCLFLGWTFREILSKEIN